MEESSLRSNSGSSTLIKSWFYYPTLKKLTYFFIHHPTSRGGGYGTSPNGAAPRHWRKRWVIVVYSVWAGWGHSGGGPGHGGDTVGGGEGKGANPLQPQPTGNYNIGIWVENFQCAIKSITKQLFISFKKKQVLLLKRIFLNRVSSI